MTLLATASVRSDKNMHLTTAGTEHHKSCWTNHLRLQFAAIHAMALGLNYDAHDYASRPGGEHTPIRLLRGRPAAAVRSGVAPCGFRCPTAVRSPDPPHR